MVILELPVNLPPSSYYDIAQHELNHASKETLFSLLYLVLLLFLFWFSCSCMCVCVCVCLVIAVICGKVNHSEHYLLWGLKVEK